MKITLIAILATLSFSSFAASKTVAQCAVENVSAGKGARVNLLQDEKTGEFKANLIFGTTVSGTAYRVKEVKTGVFEGTTRNKPQFTIRLVISKKGTANRSINGFASTLEAVYPDLNSFTGKGEVKTTAKDNFVCGKKIANF